MRSLLRLIVAALMTATPFAFSDIQLPPPSFPTDVELVRLDVTAVDGQGEPVTDLEVSEFEVQERGRSREIITFELISVTTHRSSETAEPARVSTPRALAPENGHCFLIFFDDVHISSPITQWVRQNLAPFLETEVKEGDWVTVVAPEEHVWWTARTSWEHRQLPKLIRGLSGQFVRNPFGGNDYAAMRMVEYGSRTGADAVSRGGLDIGGPRDSMLHEEVYAAAQNRVRRTLAALREAVESLAGFRGRRTLFLLSEGFIRAPRLEDLYEEVIEAARRSNVTVHFVAPQGLVRGCDTQMCLETIGGGSALIAAETGGRSHQSNDVVASIRNTLQESSTYYLLGIRPLDDDPGEHRVRVRVRRRGVRINARRGYFVTAAEGPKNAALSALKALRAIPDATDMPMQVSTTLDRYSMAGTVAVELSVHLDSSQENGQARRLGLLIEARLRDGGKSLQDAAEVTLPAAATPKTIVRRLVLPQGGLWQARVVVVDLDTGALGSVRHTFEVSSPSGR